MTEPTIRGCSVCVRTTKSEKTRLSMPLTSWARSHITEQPTIAPVLVTSLLRSHEYGIKPAAAEQCSDACATGQILNMVWGVESIMGLTHESEAAVLYVNCAKWASMFLSSALPHGVYPHLLTSPMKLLVLLLYKALRQKTQTQLFKNSLKILSTLWCIERSRSSPIRWCLRN